MNILKYIFDFLFPPSEIVKKIESLSAEDLLLHAASPLEDPGDTIISFFNYKDPLVQQALWELKYRGNSYVAKLFADVLYDEIIEYIADQTLFQDFTEPIIIPIPLSKARLHQRGWNQTEMIADALQKKDKNRSFTVQKDILIKKFHTSSQTKLSRSQRMKNLKGCFEVIKPDDVKNRNIILLDDVTTTGSTIKEASSTLKKAGARHIVAFTIGH